MHLFFAEGLEAGTSSPESDEELELVRRPASEIAELIGQVEDAKTLVGLFLYLRDRDAS
jgi:hypothetical protein